MERILVGKYGNPGRSGHFLSRNSADAVFASRLAIAEFLNLKSPERICFTHNATYALNLAIIGTASRLANGFDKPLFITDVFEHNSVLRPLYRLEREGKIRLKIIAPDICDPTSSILRAITKDASAMVLTALGNTAGDSFDLRLISQKAKKENVFFICDASQALGSVIFDMESIGADIICAPCHKGLLGIMGAGFLAFGNDCKIYPEAIISGGSGSESQNHFMPSLLPDRLEAGTLAVPAICAVKCGIEYLEMHGIGEIESIESLFKKQFIEALSNMPNIILYGAKNPHGPILFNIKNKASDEIAAMLDNEGIAVRAGFHCAPLAHEYYRTGENGAIRISPGPFTSRSEIRLAIDKIYRLAK